MPGCSRGTVGDGPRTAHDRAAGRVRCGGMTAARPMPLRELEEALRAAPDDALQLRAVLALTLGRWYLAAGDVSRAEAYLRHALEALPDLRPAIRLLERIDEAKGNVRGLVATLDREIRATRHPREAAALYRERGRIVERHFRDLAAARQCYEAALAATPEDLAIARSLERIALVGGDLASYAASLARQADIVQDPGRVAALLHEMALLETRRGGDARLAGDLLLSALEAAGPSPLLVEDMFRVADAMGDADLLLRATELWARHPGIRRTVALARAGSEFRAQQDAAAAAALLRTAARSAPEVLALWRAVEETAPAAGRADWAFEAALAVLRPLGGRDAALRSQAYLRAAQIALQHLDRIPESIAAVRRALQLDPTNLPAAELARRHLGARGMWGQYLEILRLELATAEAAARTATERADLHVHVGEILADRLDEPEAARRAFLAALELRPAFRPARDRLERVLYELGRLDDLRAFFREELEGASASRAVHILSILGQLADSAGDADEAIALHVALLKRVPEHLPALQRLARLLARAGRTDQLVKITEQEIRLTLRPARKAKLLHRVGELRLELGDIDGARAAFEEAVELVDDHGPSLAALADVLRTSGDDAGLVEVLRKQLLYTGDRPRRIALRMEIARILAERLGRPADALDELLHLLDSHTRHLAAFHAAEGLAARLDRTDVLIDLLERHATAVQGPKTRALLLHRSAHARIRADVDPNAAVGDLVRALDLWPDLGVARVQLLQMYERLGRTRELQTFAEGGLSAARSPAERRALALQLAELTKRPVSAVQYLAEAARDRPDDYVTWARLSRAARHARRFGRQAEALRHVAGALEATPAHPARLALWYRAGRADEAAGNLEGADDAYARVLDAEPGHALALRGRRRIKAARGQPAMVVEPKASGEDAKAIRAARAVMAAERAEHLRRFDVARTLAEKALAEVPDFLPALWLLARLDARSDDPKARARAVARLDAAAEHTRTPETKARTLCRAAEVLMRDDSTEAVQAAGERLAAAMTTAPGAEEPVRGLLRLSAAGTVVPVPAVGPALRARLDHLMDDGRLTCADLKVVANLASLFVGPKLAAELLERGTAAVEPDAAVLAHFAHALARLGRWRDATGRLEAAIAAESSPERRAALHFLAAQAWTEAGDAAMAIDHLVAAADAGYRSREVLERALALAEAEGDATRTVAVLERLVEVEDGPARLAHLRALATAYGEGLGRPEAAAEIMQQLLLQRPTDLELVEELYGALSNLDRPDEARAAALTSLIQHRAALRGGVSRATEDGLGLSPEVLRAFVRLYQLLDLDDGVLVATALLEAIDPEALPPQARADALAPDPLPLPNPIDGDLIDLVGGDLEGAFLLDLLRDVARSVEGGSPGDAPSGALMPEGAPAVLVAQALARTMGVALPPMYVREQPPDLAEVRLDDHPILVVGRRIASAPFVPWARARLARALFRSAVAGLAPEAEAAPEIGALVHAVARLGPRPVPEPTPEVEALVPAWSERMEGISIGESTLEAAADFLQRHRADAPAVLLRTLRAAEDRIATVLAGDPRPVVAEIVRNAVPSSSARLLDLATFVLSDEHLDLRVRIGYARTGLRTVAAEVAS
ncbi:MAG: hypothetical protein D6705_17285 [Deltaproteobacteria bacterium]|nr:MAG: hypothetical protein D6705_17285 [Deltaproteobacteria bacterium]